MKKTSLNVQILLGVGAGITLGLALAALGKESAAAQTGLYLSELIGKIICPYSEMNVGRSYLEVPDENVTEAFVIILARVHRNMFAMLIENFHDQAEPDYFRPGAENRHYLHMIFSAIRL